MSAVSSPSIPSPEARETPVAAGPEAGGGKAPVPSGPGSGTAGPGSGTAGPESGTSLPAPGPAAPGPGAPWPESLPALDFLNDLIRTGIKYGLENFGRLLDHLDHPEQGARWVHVAGTNGKGSVSAMVESLLRAHGEGTTLFTSPHLVHPRERFRVDGRPVSPEVFTEAMAPIQAASARMEADGHGTPTFFEACTGLTFELAGRRPGTWGVAECGLGGRLDATNLLVPEVGVITSIGLDHTKTLGDTLELIAAEKAGIAKPGVPLLVSSCIPEGPRKVIEEVARGKGAEVLAPESEILDARLDGTHRVMRFSLRTPEATYTDLELPLLGPHQLANACLAVRALELALGRQGNAVDPEAVRRGLATVRWAGRFDHRHFDGGEVLLDAVHNPQGMQAFMSVWEQCFPGRRATVLFGACSDKNVDALLRPLAGFASEFVFAQAHVRRAAPADLLAERYLELALPDAPPCGVAPSVAEGWDLAWNAARARGELLVVCGSLYLLGDVLALPGSPDVDD